MEVDEGEPAAASQGTQGTQGTQGPRSQGRERAPVVPMPSGRRLVIKRMVLENFKSYAGRQTIGPFHGRFTAVVGPNGSGKSNVLDALLFKISELVHRSAAHPSLQQASVEVVFAEFVPDPVASPGEDAEVEVPGTELVLTRTATVGNQSKYLVNGRPSSFTEVTDLLRLKGVDLENNRFLILQGEVEQIAMMPPKRQGAGDEGMLEYLEDIIGTARYIEQIDAATAALEEVQEQRTEKLNRVKLAGREKADIEAAKVEAEEYVAKDRRIIECRSAIAQLQRRECERKIESVSAKQAELSARLKQEKEKAAALATKVKEKELQFKKASKEHDALTAAMNEAKEGFAQFKRRDIQLREDTKHFKSQIKRLTKTLEAEAARAESLDRDVEQARVDAEAAERRVEELRGQLGGQERALEEAYESLKGETSGLQERMEALQAELVPSRQQMHDLDARAAVARSELELIEQSSGEHGAALRRALAQRDEMQALEAKTMEELERVKGELKQQKQRVAKCRERVAELAREEEELVGQIRDMRMRVEELRSASESSSSRGALHDAIRRLKDTNEIPGIHGRLGDLGAIDKKYDVAISSACGALDNIVVETTEAGERCVEYLREHRLGRTTFIILERLGRAAEEAAAPFDGPAPRLVDLIKLKNEKFRPAFYHALRNTLVAPNLDAASAIAYGRERHRVVTLQGEVIDTSGTMSGGGNRVARGGMASAVVTDAETRELSELEPQLAALVARLEAVRSSRAAAERDAAAAESLSGASVAKLEMDARSQRAQRDEAARAVAELEGREALTGEQRARLADLRAAVAGAEEAKAAIVESCGAQEQRIEAIKEQIMAAGGSHLRELKNAVADLAARIEEAERERTRRGVDARTHAKNAERARAAGKRAEEECEATRAKLEAAHGEQKALEDEALEVLARYEDAQKAVADKAPEMKALAREREQLQGEAAGAGEEVQLQTELEECTRALKELQGRAQAQSQQVGALAEAMRGFEEVLGEELPALALLTEEQLAGLRAEALRAEIEALEEAKSAVSPNMAAIREFKRKEREYEERARELDEATARRNELAQRCAELKKRRLDEFMEGFERISLNLKEMYRKISQNGDAELELVDRMNPFSEGVVFSVRPAKKSWKNITNLSGGEKTLSSLALVFALHKYKPTPLYVMDEIDAALDFRNVTTVANYIKEKTVDAQFIVVSLRNHMFELADRLVGIFKVDDCTRSVAISPADYAI
eukprot:m51a1_g14097 putative structural maintenance of chromosomes protein 4 (1237) ;mRNA; f:82387-87578